MLQKSSLYQAEGKIWKLLLDEAKSILIIEQRQEETQEASFSAFDLTNRQPIWEDFMLEEEWWIQAHNCTNGVLIFSEWEEDSPVSKAVMAIDVLAGEGLWQFNNMAFVANDSQTISLQENETGKILRLGLHSGEATQEQVNALENTSSLKLPSSYNEEIEYFKTVSKFLQTKFGYSPAMSIDYLETPAHIIIAFHEQEDIYFNQKLLILNRQGVLISEELLNRQLKGAGTEPFLLWKHQLFYIKEKQELILVDLNE